MKRKKAYVLPQVIRVKLEPTQAVLSQCSLGVTDISHGLGPTSNCSSAQPCKQFHNGDSEATS